MMKQMTMDDKKIEDAAKDFFFTFSKFEYALKAAGFVKTRDRDTAEVDWNKFKITLADVTIDENEDSFVRYFKGDAPRRQILKDCQLQEGASYKVTTAEECLNACCTLRNNLFHGEKMRPISSTSNRERNYKLLVAGKKIVEQIIRKAGSPIGSRYDDATLK